MHPDVVSNLPLPRSVLTSMVRLPVVIRVLSYVASPVCGEIQTWPTFIAIEPDMALPAMAPVRDCKLADAH